jgi:D-alanine-D-alanine ligase
MRVLVITGDHALPDPTKWDGAYAEGDLELHRETQAALESLPGYSFEFLTDHAALAARLERDPPELVLNFCDTGFRNVATQELHVAALLELHGIPYTGAGPAGMVLCYDKGIVRAVAQSHGVPVPGEVLVPAAGPVDLTGACWPSLIKPAQGDGSVGIRPDAVVRNEAEARRYLEWFRSELPGRAALVQEFLPGTEYGLGLVGNPAGGFVAFPPLEVDYSALPAGMSPILAFESKTGPSNPYDAVGIKPAELDAERIAEMRAHSELLFERLQCRDYARFDFRTDAAGRIKLLEANPNPAWSSQGKLARMAAFGETSYVRFLELILRTARGRLSL